MTLPFGTPTYSVSELCGEIREFLSEAFSSLWVAGEVQRVRRSQRGHLYFELIEKGPGDGVIGKLDTVLWSRDHGRVRKLLAASGQEIAEGQQIRCRGDIDFYPAGGRLQFVVREVDPIFTLGLLEQRRRETLSALTAAGLVERNGRLPVPALPLRIGLVTSQESAAYHDFLSSLRHSGYGFQVLFSHASVQGASAAEEIVSALAGLASAGNLDGVALIRGGGSRTDLAVFDSREVAEAVATAPFPVWTGLGHQIDRSITDMVAHTELTTPTKVAEHLIERVAGAEGRLVSLSAALRAGAVAPLASWRGRIQALEATVRRVGQGRLNAGRDALEGQARALARVGHGRLRVAAAGCDSLAERLVEGPGRSLRRQAGEPQALLRRLLAHVGGQVREAEASLDGLERLCRELSPQRILERGFTLTRDGVGDLVRRAADLAIGETLTTQTAAGTFTSRVETR